MKQNKEMGVIGQVRVAMGNPVALTIGCLLGGFVPFATYFVAHTSEPGFDVSMALVLGGLVYSAKTVWAWGRMAFNDTFKATGFVLLLEGVMVTSKLSWLAVAALCYLVAINAVATGCLLALRDAPPVPKAKKVAPEVVKAEPVLSGKAAPKRVRKAPNRDTIPAPEHTGEFEIEQAG